MSIRIEPIELAAAVRGRDFVYLVTRGDERSHVVALKYSVEGKSVTMRGAGRSSITNIERASAVALVWPPAPLAPENSEYSIVADGTAMIDGESVVVDVVTAVFHRPAP
ncbi:MAG: hypothetical protein ACKOJ9_07275 [Actinomycetota bacterium]